MAAVSKIVRDAVKARLQSAWATKLAAVESAYTGVPAADKALLSGIDWAGTTKKQVFQGQVDVASLADSTAISYPLVILYASDANHDGAEKFITFSGSVSLNVEFHFTWRKASALPNFDEFMDLIEDAFIETVHDKSWLGALNPGLSYRGEIAIQRAPVDEDGQNWLQAIAFRMVFGVDI